MTFDEEFGDSPFVEVDQQVPLLERLAKQDEETQRIEDDWLCSSVGAGVSGVGDVVLAAMLGDIDEVPPEVFHNLAEEKLFEPAPIESADPPPSLSKSGNDALSDFERDQRGLCKGRDSNRALDSLLGSIRRLQSRLPAAVDPLRFQRLLEDLSAFTNHARRDCVAQF